MKFKQGDVVVHDEKPHRIYTGKMLFYVEGEDTGFGVPVAQVTSDIKLRAQHWFPADELKLVGRISGSLDRSKPPSEKTRGENRGRSFLPNEMHKFEPAKRKAAQRAGSWISSCVHNEPGCPDKHCRGILNSSLW